MDALVMAFASNDDRVIVATNDGDVVNDGEDGADGSDGDASDSDSGASDASGDDQEDVVSDMSK